MRARAPARPFAFAATPDILAPLDGYRRAPMARGWTEYTPRRRHNADGTRSHPTMHTERPYRWKGGGGSGNGGSRRQRRRPAKAVPGESGVWRKPAPGKPPTGQGARAVFRRTLGAPARTALPCGSRAALPCGGLVDFRPNVCLQKKAGHFTNECMPIGTLRTGRAQPTGRLPGMLQNEKEKRGARGRISHTLDGEMTNVFWKTRTRGSNDQSWPADGRA